MIIAGVEVLDERGRTVPDTSATEQEADQVRTHLAPRPVAGQIKTPDDIIVDLEWAKHLASKSAAIIRDADRTLRALLREYNRRLVVEMKKSERKSADERLMEADTVLAEWKAAVDEAEVVLAYAKRVANSVESSTSAIQTQAKQIQITYELAGSGR